MRDARVPADGIRTGAAAEFGDPLRRYLLRHPWAAEQLTWTLNVDHAAVYALEPSTPTRWVQLSLPTLYLEFLDSIAGHAARQQSDAYVSRVSLAGSLPGRGARLMSGRIVPVVEVATEPGAAASHREDAAPLSQPHVDVWRENAILRSAVSGLLAHPRLRSDIRHVDRSGAVITEATVRNLMSVLLSKAYAALRNSGRSPADRAINYLGTTLIGAAGAPSARIPGWDLTDALLPGWALNDVDALGLYTLGGVTVTKSPVDRMNGDCWDVELLFFDPTDTHRARLCYVFTVDVSDQIPVVLPGLHRFVTMRAASARTLT